MKFFGKISHPKDLTTKEYVDKKADDLDKAKVNSTDINEYTSQEVNDIWNVIFTDNKTKQIK